MKYQDPTILPQSQDKPAQDKPAQEQETIDTSKLKPSELIRLALRDLELCEKSPRYIIDMSFWHGPFLGQGNHTCNVCFAGAVMAITKKTPFHEELSKNDIPTEILALDSFRAGSLGRGLAVLKIDNKALGLPNNVPAIPYAMDRAGFKKDMINLANLLENSGL